MQGQLSGNAVAVPWGGTDCPSSSSGAAPAAAAPADKQRHIHACPALQQHQQRPRQWLPMPGRVIHDWIARLGRPARPCLLAVHQSVAFNMTAAAGGGFAPSAGAAGPAGSFTATAAAAGSVMSARNRSVSLGYAARPTATGARRDVPPAPLANHLLDLTPHPPNTHTHTHACASVAGLIIVLVILTTSGWLVEWGWWWCCHWAAAAPAGTGRRVQRLGNGWLCPAPVHDRSWGSCHAVLTQGDVVVI